jgi:hypothetical protein
MRRFERALHELIRVPAEEVRTLELERLDVMFRAVFPTGGRALWGRARPGVHRQGDPPDRAPFGPLGLDRLPPIQASVTVPAPTTAAADQARLAALLAACQGHEDRLAGFGPGSTGATTP